MKFSHLHFVQSVEPLEGGGLGRAAIELNTQFNLSQDRSLLIATRDRTFHEQFEHVRQFKRNGIHKFFFSYDLFKNIDKLVNNFDLIHGHGFYVYPNMHFGFSSKKFNKPLIYHVHGIFEPWILNRSKWKKRFVHLLFENRNFVNAKLWRALTLKEADQIRNKGISAPIIVAPNGIHLDQFDTVDQTRIKYQTRKRVLFLARLHPKKGLDMLIGAWAQLGELVKDWELIIAGPDENGHQRIIESIVAKNKLEDSVKFIGPIIGPEKISLIKSSDLFILPSYSEGFSVAVLEAMACRVPVIATDACNFPEIATNGGGWECSVSVDGIRKALQDAISCGEEELKQRGKLGRELVESRYQWGRIAEDISNACQQYCR